MTKSTFFNNPTEIKVAEQFDEIENFFIKSSEFDRLKQFVEIVFKKLYENQINFFLFIEKSLSRYQTKSIFFSHQLSKIGQIQRFDEFNFLEILTKNVTEAKNDILSIFFKRCDAVQLIKEGRFSQTLEGGPFRVHFDKLLPTIKFTRVMKKKVNFVKLLITFQFR